MRLEVNSGGNGNSNANGAGSAWRAPEKIRLMTSVQFMDGLWREWACCGRLLDAAQVAAAVAPYQCAQVATTVVSADDDDHEQQHCRAN
jgi:hypothetical protein